MIVLKKFFNVKFVLKNFHIQVFNKNMILLVEIKNKKKKAAKK